MTRAKIISIEIETGDAGLFHATSPQMGELFVSGESVEEVLDAVPAVIEAIYKAHGKEVSALPADNDDVNIPMPWVILSGDQAVVSC